MSVKYIGDKDLFVLTSNNLMYAFEISDDGYPVNLYYGRCLKNFYDLPLGEMYFFRNGTEGRIPNDGFRREYTANGR